MAEEFIIKSQDIENKINQLLPSQGGFQAGVDFSASTMVIPIVDLTETAEGSILRQDLQVAETHSNTTNVIVNTTTTVVSTTGFYSVAIQGVCKSGGEIKVLLSDGSTDTTIRQFGSDAGLTRYFDDTFNVFIKAGGSCKASSSNGDSAIIISTRQIADISGNLTNPSGFTS